MAKPTAWFTQQMCVGLPIILPFNPYVNTCLWLLFLLLISFRLPAQPFTSRTLSIQQGLPEYYVTGLIQDKAGFVWIATRDGLARYDGQHFRIFRHQPHTNPSIASNIILSLQLVADSTILIHLGNGGFQRLNPITEQFSDLLTDQQLAARHIEVAGATLTPDGKDFWGRHQARLIHYLPHQKQLTIYPLPPIQLPRNAFIGNASVLTPQVNLYAPFPGGLLEFNTHSHRFRQFVNRAIDAQPVVETYYGTPIIQRANGELLIGGARQLITFNPLTHRFRSTPIPNPVDTQVGQIHAGIDGNIYFTLAMTVYRMTPDDQITPLWTAPRIDYRNYFHALLLDRSGVLWVGTNGDGVQQIDLRSLPIKIYPYQTNFVADVLSLELGLSVPDWVNAYDMPYRLRLGGSASYGTAWFANAYHLFRLDQARRILHPLLAIPWPKEYHVPGEGNGMRVLPTGQIWMYNLSQGLIRTDTAGRQPAVFPCSIHWVSDIQPLGSWVWISSEFDGLYAYDPGARRIVRHLRYQSTDSTSICSNHIGCLTADPHDPAVLWVGTQEGLSRLDTRTLRCQNWSEKQGLPSATINTLLTDRRGWIWFSTLKGISRLDPQSRRMRHFSTADEQ